MALYFGLFSCLYDVLLHSSIIINPMFFKGANIALLAPTTSFTSHFNIFLYSSYFSPSLSLECSIATSFENSLLSLDIICGVRLISGTRKIDVCPLFKQSFINFIYISVVLFCFYYFLSHYMSLFVLVLILFFEVILLLLKFFCLLLFLFSIVFRF